jgi:cytochrome c551/c552
MTMVWNPRTLLVGAALLLPGGAIAETKSAGQLAYETHCVACHMVDSRWVGPSLVKMVETYPDGEVEAFLAWVKNPGKKDPKMIQMPAMSHLPEDVVTDIHNYVVQVTEGKVEKRGRHHFKGFKEPERKLPYVVRSFMPHSSPASILIKLPGDLNACWDTEACRFRYVWSDEKTINTSGRGEPKFGAPPQYRETAPSLWSFADGVKPQFKGYRLIEGYPEFDYAYGAIQIREKVVNGAEPGTVLRQFNLLGVTDGIVMDLTNEGVAMISADAGRLADGKLTLTREEAASFTLNISQP